MNDSTRVISPLRQRMLEDMRLRKLAPKTQVAYIRSVRGLVLVPAPADRSLPNWCNSSAPI